MIHDFVIPTFEQFQYLRELRKIQRRNQDECTEQGTSPSNKNTKKHVLQVVQSRSQGIRSLPCDTSNNNDRNVENDSSTTQIAHRYANVTTTLEEYSDLSHPRIIDTPHKNPNLGFQKFAVTPIQVQRRHDEDVSPTTNSSNLQPPKFIPVKQKNGIATISSMTYQNLVTASSSLAVGGPFSPIQESSPEPDEEEIRPTPWFQRKRRRKLQQTRLSFATST